MDATTTLPSASRIDAGGAVAQGFPYKAMAIFPNFADAGNVLLSLNKEGFSNEQLSLLGQGHEHWQEDLGQEWEKLKVAKGAAAGAALGAIPGLVLVTGVALTGGVGLLVAGPMIAAMTAAGMGSLVGGVMGAGSSKVAGVQKLAGEKEMTDEINRGNWVIVVHSRTETEAAHAQSLLRNTGAAQENESPPDGPAGVFAEQEVMEKLSKVVSEAFHCVAKVSKLPMQEVMCNIETIDVAELKQAAREANKHISDATDLDTAQIAEIFKTNRIGSIAEIANRLHEQSRINRNRF